MKAKLISLILLAVIFVPSLIGQTNTLAPAGTQWYYNIDYNAKGYTKIESLRDTFLADINKKATICNHILFEYYKPLDTVRSYLEFDFITYSIGDSIMARWSGEETVFFIKQKGACWKYNSPDSFFNTSAFEDTAKICVDSVGEYTIGDTTFPTAYYASFLRDRSYMVKGPFVPNIGFISYFLPEPNYIFDYGYGKGPIRCYSDSVSGLMKFNDTIACDSLYTKKGFGGVGWARRGGSANIELYPNPARQEVKIKTPSDARLAYFELLDLNGKLLTRRTLSAHNPVVDLNEIPKGLYVIRFYFEDHIPVSKKLVRK